VARLRPPAARIRSLWGLATGEALTVHYYRDAGLARWVRRTLAEQHIDAAVVFSSSMAQYVENVRGLRLLVDFVDVDSAKWQEYADNRKWPLSWLYRREGQKLLNCERRVAARAERSFFVTEDEAAMFGQLAPECASQVESMCNGVDGDYFSPDPARASPFDAGEVPLVFTGAMDYWPNVDAVCWFAREVLPALRQRDPRVRFHIVGRAPAPAVQALAGEAVHVSGTVPDVRPYLQHAAVVVAPLRLARGIQNKVLEAMAMARPVVASMSCAQPVRASLGHELLAAVDAPDYVRQISQLLSDPSLASALGAAGRRCVLSRYSWPVHLGGIDRHLQTAGAAA
jgi:sugar transferase (PEP-CTERM/EpsH1 system associated)